MRLPSGNPLWRRTEASMRQSDEPSPHAHTERMSTVCPSTAAERTRGEVSGREERRGSRRINGHNSSRMNTKYKGSLRGPHGRGDGIPQNATPVTPPTALSLQSLLLFKRTPRPLVPWRNRPKSLYLYCAITHCRTCAHSRWLNYTASPTSVSAAAASVCMDLGEGLRESRAR